MLIDCFPYFNERELLELRLKMHYDRFDLFVITEGTRTHRGIPKPLSAYNVIKDAGIPLTKIELVKVEMPSSEEEPENWVRERMQRDAATRYINDNDIAFVSDCDEIIDPVIVDELVEYTQNNPKSLLRVPLVYLLGDARFRVYKEEKIELWPSPFMCTNNHLKKYTLSQIREDQAKNLHEIKDFQEVFPVINGNQIRDAGWHFAWMGGPIKRHMKFKTFLHDDEYYMMENYVPSEGNTDPLGRGLHILRNYPMENLPKKIFELENVRKFLLPDEIR